MSDHRENFWSIGEVLSLLQDEFPEVTISKIRFLEGQGLIDPERTASGYRRFYQRDFDRLQWILTQQRDHYLPLRVIRDRLDAGEWQPPEHPPQAPRDGQMTLLAPVIDIGTGNERTTGDGGGDGGDDGASDDDAEPAEQASGETDAETHNAPPEPAGAAVGEAAVDAAADDGVAVDAAAVEETEPAAPSAADPVVDPSDDGQDLALTIDELADASGCDVAMIRELERFGLIEGRTAGPAVLYDADTLTIARLAAQFRTYGLDPRHLRTFLVGAQREVSLLAQVVEPLRHRRDPETRRKSVETMEDLTDLAASLRAILMRRITAVELPSR